MFEIFRRKRIKQGLKNISERTHVYHNMDTMSRICILFNYEDWNDVKLIANELEEAGKDIDLWTIEPRKSKATANPVPQHNKLKLIASKDISAVNGIPDSIIDEFRGLSYDTFIDLTTRHNILYLSLATNNNAEFSIGIKKTEYNIYDFVILKEDEKNLIETFEQIKFYLKNVR